VLLVHFSLFASLAILLSLYWSVYLYLQHWPSCSRVNGPFLSICIIGDSALIVLVRLSLFAALAILLSCYWSISLYLHHWRSCSHCIGPFISICSIGHPALVLLVWTRCWTPRHRRNYCRLHFSIRQNLPGTEIQKGQGSPKRSVRCTEINSLCKATACPNGGVLPLASSMK